MSSLKLCMEFYEEITGLLKKSKYRDLTPSDVSFVYGYAQHQLFRMVSDVIEEMEEKRQKEQNDGAPPS